MPTIAADSLRCPSCGARNAVRILYGLPDPEGVRAAEAGQVHLGGCVLTVDSPDAHCRDCGHDWPSGRRGV
jgi:DNA-directed RNA polymerase subunit RPC12/RpoP